MAGKLDDEQVFALEKRLKKSESIVNTMTDEERADPELICKMVNCRTYLHVLDAADLILVYLHFL